LQRKSGGTVNSTPTPVDTTLNNSEIKSSDSLTSSENTNKKGKVTDYLSALSGSSPGGSTVERTRSETDLKYSYKYPSSGEESFIPFDQDATPKLLARILPLSSVLLLKRVTHTDAKMVNYLPASFDANLEYIVMVILNLTLNHPLALALSQSFVKLLMTFGQLTLMMFMSLDTI
jgi:hypothetical protein